LIDGSGRKQHVFDQHALSVQVKSSKVLFGQALQTRFKVVHRSVRFAELDLLATIRKLSSSRDLKSGCELRSFGRSETFDLLERRNWSLHHRAQRPELFYNLTAKFNRIRAFATDTQENSH